MIKKGLMVKGAKVLVLGITFKENCPDVRNTKVVDIIRTLEKYDICVTVHDPWASPAVAEDEYGVSICNEKPDGKYDAIVLAVAHRKFEELDIPSLLNNKSILYDVKGMLKCYVDGKL